MRQFGFTLALVFCALSVSRHVSAQNFWYVPPGYDYGYYYGLDAGNGVHFGYGIGVGFPLSNESVIGSSNTNVGQSWNQPSVVSPTPQTPVVSAITQPVPVAKMPVMNVKKKVAKKQVAKGMPVQVAK